MLLRGLLPVLIFEHRVPPAPFSGTTPLLILVRFVCFPGTWIDRLLFWMKAHTETNDYTICLRETEKFHWDLKSWILLNEGRTGSRSSSWSLDANVSTFLERLTTTILWGSFCLFVWKTAYDCINNNLKFEITNSMSDNMFLNEAFIPLSWKWIFGL